jgi:hypothetical protein
MSGYYIFDPNDKLRPYRGSNIWVGGMGYEEDKKNEPRVTTFKDVIPFESYADAERIVIETCSINTNVRIVNEKELIALML